MMKMSVWDVWFALHYFNVTFASHTMYPKEKFRGIKQRKRTCIFETEIRIPKQSILKLNYWAVEPTSTPRSNFPGN